MERSILTTVNFLLLLTIMQMIRGVDVPKMDECLDLPFNICGNEGSLMMAPLNKNKKLIGWWTFDDKFAHDYSGNNLDGSPVPEAGPPYCKNKKYI